ncbi:MAG TPA: hypothetical protein VHZ55_00805 [Bryobacteraceae bacterium]|jgi:hypothetical protein|nr:hypothetical protein [Bryobacteraceae bacterium]
MRSIESADEFKQTFARDVILEASVLLHPVQGIEKVKTVMGSRTNPIMKQVISERLVEFIVTFYTCVGNGNDNPFAHPDISVMFSRRSSQTPCDEHSCHGEEWTYFVALRDVDTFEQAVARCSYVISYERSLIPGEYARTKTVCETRPFAVNEAPSRTEEINVRGNKGLAKGVDEMRLFRS